MKNIKIDEIIDELGVITPSREKFFELSKMTPVVPGLEYMHHINFERGILLYALISKLKPKSIIEIGTAEGYSTLCMAWALSDNDIDGKIYTIDPKSHDEKRQVIINDIVQKDKLSTREIWEKFALKEWIEKIEVITGFSGQVFSRRKFPKIDFAYIDGSHIYEAVKHDFFAILNNSAENFNILFDDYVPSSGDGVAKVMDEEIIENFQPIIIESNVKKQRIELKNERAVDHFMCLLNSNSSNVPLKEIYSYETITKELKKYQDFEKRIIIRKKINEKIPFLENIKFRFWNK